MSTINAQPILWEDDGPDRIRGCIANPKMTLFIIERHPTKPYRGRMTGAVIPDEDVAPDGLLGNALISWLQGCAAPMYLNEFIGRIQAIAEADDSPGEKLVTAERIRHGVEEGWTAEHDDKHDRGELALAGLAYYAADKLGYKTPGDPPIIWPWAKFWFKPAGEIRNCVKAAALVRAERERLVRLEKEIIEVLNIRLAEAESSPSTQKHEPHP